VPATALGLLALLAISCSGGATAETGAAAAVHLNEQDVRLVTLTVGERPADRVVDRADILSADDEERIGTRLRQHEAATTDQVVVVTVPTLQGLEIERFGYALGNHWGVGRADADNGVLMILAPTERKMRIEVGEGLERVLSNARAAEIIQTMVPALSHGRYGAAVEAGVGEIIGTLDADRERRHAA
jgi:uncharacterized protein